MEKIENIVVDAPYVIEKFELDSKMKKIKSSVKVVKGEFVRHYHYFYLFKSENGICECLMKKTLGIDWSIRNKKKVS